MIKSLLINEPDGGQQTLQLDGDLVSLGRSRDNTLPYPADSSLSRHHLVFERDGDIWRVRDLESKNGTQLNGTPLEGSLRLYPGDRIQAGRLLMIFDDPSGARTEEVEFHNSEETPLSLSLTTSLEEALGAREEAQTVSAAGVSAGTQRAAAAFAHPAVKALLKAGRELVLHRPLPELFRLILTLSLDAVGAERGAIMTLEDGSLVTRAINGERLRISTAVRDRVLGHKQSVLVRDTTSDVNFADRESIHGQKIRTMMAVPLQTEGRLVGLIYLDSRRAGRPMTGDDLSLLTVLGNVAAMRIEQERLEELERVEAALQLELEQAAEIQKRLLPGAPPVIPGVDLAGDNVACRTVGGDYYGFFEYQGGRVGIALGDVAGKGMPAALLMASLQARVETLAEEPDDIAAMMGRLDRIMALKCPRNRFVSFFFAVIDGGQGKISYCNAGHNPPCLIHGDGRVEWLEEGGTILGILPERPYEITRRPFERGQLLALFSDGVTEAIDPAGTEFGVERLATFLRDQRDRSAAEIVSALRSTLDDWMAGGAPADDITMLIARRVA